MGGQERVKSGKEAQVPWGDLRLGGERRAETSGPLFTGWSHSPTFLAAIPIVCVYVCAQSVNCVQFFATPWTVAGQVPLSLGFSRQECWSRLPCPLPGDLPDPGIEPMSPVVPTLAGGFFTTEAQGKPMAIIYWGSSWGQALCQLPHSHSFWVVF